MPRSLIQAFLILCMLLTLVAPTTAEAATADSGISSWQCLPEETAVAVRIPNGKTIFDACKKDTKMGAVLFSDKRREILAEALRKSSSSEWAEFEKQLADHGLTTKELLQFFAGESGYALVVAKDADDKPLALGLSWLQPGEKLAAKSYDVLARSIEEQEDSERPIGRVDLELADHPVMRLMLPHVSTEHAERMDTPEGYDQMSEEEQESARDEAYKRWEESAVEKTEYTAVLVSTVGDRILLAHGFRQHETQDDHPDAAPLEELFTRFLAEHEKGEGGFVSKYADDANVSRVTSLEGIGVFELMGDVAALLPLARSAAEEGPATEAAEKIIRILGLDCLGPFIARSTLEDTHWHSQFGLAISQPHQGLMKWFDQTPLETEPPAWVPANAITYSQISFDLGKAYAVLKEELTREFPDQAGQYFSMAEMQVFGPAQASLEEVLSSLGSRHVILNFEAPVDTSSSLDNQKPESTSVVWQVTDEQLWSRVIQAVAPMATQMAGGEVADEQGYNGIRFKSDAAEGGLFLGNGNLVLAYGPQVLETVLSALNNPPEGAGALRGSEVYRQASELLETAPSCAYKIVDGNRYGAIFRTWMLEFLKAHKNDAENAEDGAMWADTMTELMPTEDEMKGMLGVIVSRWDVTDTGIFGATVQETPAP